MKILLIRPPVPYHTIGLKHIMICEPLELEYVAAGLRDHHVEIFDMIVERGLERHLRRFKPDIVGTSSYITGVNEVKKLCRIVKRWNPDCFTVVGGVHASRAPEDFAELSVDCIVRGDGTSVMPEIVAALESGRSIREIPGLAVPTSNNQLEFTAERSYMPDPDSLPFPRRDLVYHLKNRYYYLFHRPVATMKTTWGCWYKCDFCFTTMITDGIPYSRSPESIVDELERIDSEDVYIVDDIFLYNPERLSKIARLVRDRKIHKKFLVFGRADFIAENEEIIAEWASIGLTAVLVGLEATTDSELKLLNKQCSVDHNRLAIEVLRRHGIDTYGSFIPQPDYLPEDWRRLQNFINETGLYYINISPLTPMPGTLIWNQYEDMLSVERSAHGLWDLTHTVLPTRMPLKQYYRSLLEVYARTTLDIGRANRLTLRTRPPVWSHRYLRLWLGAIRIFLQLLSAHRHHGPRHIARAQDTGPDFSKPQDTRRDENKSESGLKNSQLERINMKRSSHFTDLTQTHFSSGDIRRLEDPFHGFFDENFSWSATEGGLLDVPEAKRWYRTLEWAHRNRFYALQQTLQKKSGPRVMISGKEFLMISSYDYLGFIGHPDIESASIEAISKYGTGTGGVRLLTGTTDLHRKLEAELSEFKGTEAALTFNSGYMANLGIISSLFGKNDRVIIDSRVHQSVRDACRLAQTTAVSFNHNDPDSLEKILKDKRMEGRTLIIVEGVYSMDGDICPLPEIVDLKKKYGAYLMVDEAHSFCVLGSTGKGIDEHFGLETKDVDIWMGSLSKAIPSNGGFVAGSQELIIYLQHGASPFMFTAAVGPPALAAARASIQILRREPEILKRVHENAAFLKTHLTKLGFNTGITQSPIVPVIVGKAENAFMMSLELFKLGIVATPVTYPAVPRNEARIRLCATARQDEEFLLEVIDGLRIAGAKLSLPLGT